MAKRAKWNNAQNHWRQREYLKIGVVMLPTLKEERRTIRKMGKEGLEEAIKSKE